MPDDGRERDSSREQMEFILTVKAETLHSQANSLDFYVQKKNIERKEQTETTWFINTYICNAMGSLKSNIVFKNCNIS